MKFNNIIWDLDGTIVDSAEAVVNIMKKTADILELDDEFPYDKTDLFIGPSTEVFLESCFPNWSDEKKKTYRRTADDVARNSSNESMKLYGELDNILLIAKKRGAKNYVCTAKDEVSAVKLMKELGIIVHIDCIYGSKEGLRDKASIIAKMLKDTGLSGEECVMIGDRYTDIIGGKDNNTKTIAVLYGYGSAKELEDCQPDHIAKNVEELKEFLFV